MSQKNPRSRSSARAWAGWPSRPRCAWPVSTSQVYEQAPHFARIGAGIQMMPNSMKVLRRIGVRRSVAPALLQAVFAPEPRVGHRRGDARAAHAGESVRRALSVHASRRSARRAGLGAAGGDHSSEQEAGGAGSKGRAGDAVVRRRHARDGGRRDRRRRRAFAGARHHRRARRAASTRAASPIAPFFPPRC